MKIVITGVRGFIGSNLARYLASKDHKIIGLGRSVKNNDFQKIDIRSGKPIPNTSMSFIRHISGADALIILGGKRQDDKSNLFYEFLESNVVQTEKIVLDSVKLGLSRIIFASSIVSYPLDSPVPYVETCNRLPDTIYGISKRLAEQVITQHAKHGKYTGISLRLAQVFGPSHNSQGVLSLFINMAKENKKIQVLGNGFALRDYIYINDALYAFESALYSDVESGPINIGSNNGYTIKELALTVNDVFTNGKQNVVFKSVEIEDRSRYVMDCSKARKYLGWEPKWSLHDALLDMHSI